MKRRERLWRSRLWLRHRLVLSPYCRVCCVLNTPVGDCAGGVKASKVGPFLFFLALTAQPSMWSQRESVCVHSVWAKIQVQQGRKCACSARGGVDV